MIQLQFINIIHTHMSELDIYACIIKLDLGLYSHLKAYTLSSLVSPQIVDVKGFRFMNILVKRFQG